LVPKIFDTVDVVPIAREELAMIDPKVAVRKLDLIAVNGKDQQDVVYEIIRSDGPSAMIQDAEALAQFDEVRPTLHVARWEPVRHFQPPHDRLPDDLPSRIIVRAPKPSSPPRHQTIGVGSNVSI